MKIKKDEGKKIKEKIDFQHNLQKYIKQKPAHNSQQSSENSEKDKKHPNGLIRLKKKPVKLLKANYMSDENSQSSSSNPSNQDKR